MLRNVFGLCDQVKVGLVVGFVRSWSKLEMWSKREEIGNPGETVWDTEPGFLARVPCWCLWGKFGRWVASTGSYDGGRGRPRDAYLIACSVESFGVLEGCIRVMGSVFGLGVQRMIKSGVILRCLFRMWKQNGPEKFLSRMGGYSWGGEGFFWSWRYSSSCLWVLFLEELTQILRKTRWNQHHGMQLRIFFRALILYKKMGQGEERMIRWNGIFW